MALTDLTRVSTSGIATGTTLDNAILRKDISFKGNQVGITSALFDSSERRLDFKDNVKLRFGDSADLSLSHNINDSVISHSAAATGALKILSGGAQSIECIKAGAVNIAHNGSTKIQTTSTGTVVTGVLTATSFSGPIVGHTNNTSGISTFYDLRVSNNLTVEGTTTTLDTNLVGVDRIEVGANSNTIVGVAITQSGTADIFNLYDGSTEVFSVADGGGTTFGGVVTHNDDVNFVGVTTGRNIIWDKSNDYLRVNDNARIVFGNSGDLSIRHLSSDNKSYVSSTTNDVVHEFNIGKNWSLMTTGADKRIHCPAESTDKSVELYWNGSKKLATTNTGIDVTGVAVDDGATHNGDVTFTGANYNASWVKAKSALIFNNDAQLNFGTNEDGDIYHDSTQMIINNATGTLKVRSNNLQLTHTNNDIHINCVTGAQVELFNAGTKRFETTGTGTLTTGDLVVTDPVYLSNASTISSRLTLNSENTASWQGTRELVALDLIGNGADHRTGTLSIKIKKAPTDSSPTEMMRIDGVYNRATIPSTPLCLGTTTSPGQLGLYLGDGTNPAGHIYANGTHHMYMLANAYHDGAWKYLGNGEAQSISMTDGDFSFHTAGNNTSGAGQAITWTTRMTVSDDQNVYINGSQTGNNRAILYNGTTFFGIYGSSSSSVDRQLRFHTGGGSASERMRLSSDGFFLVNCQDTGFSSGYTDMTIGNTSASSTGLTIASHPTNGLSRLHFADGNSSSARYAGWIVYDHSVDGFLISTGNSGGEKLRIDSNGSLNFNYTNGGAYSNGGARNVIDLGSGTLNRGMGWGGTNANYANIWTEYSSGALHLGIGIRPTGTSTGWVSSYGGSSIGRSALKMDLNGNITMYTAENSTVAAGGATNLTQKWFLHKQGGITHQFAGRHGHVIGSTDGSGAYFLLDGQAGGTLASGSDYMYMEHTSTGQFEMWNGKTGTATSKFLDVYPEGYVTKPKTPSFYGRGYNGNSGGRWKFDEVATSTGPHNTGSHFDNSTGIFTCPVAGKYFVSGGYGYLDAANFGSVGYSYNGTTKLMFWEDGRSGQGDRHVNGAFSVVVECAANDELAIVLSTGYAAPETTSQYAFGSIYLLG